MKLRVKYYKDMGKWIGEVQDDDTMKWLMKTYGCHTKYGAKRELRKWYKREVAPEKIEEIDPADLVGGELIDIFVLHNLMFLLFSLLHNSSTFM